MKLPACLLLCAASLACASPTAEIATDGIRLGWRFGAFHPFLKGDFEFEHESSSYNRWVDDSLVESEADDFWWHPEWELGAGIDWELFMDPVHAGLRAETKYVPDVFSHSDRAFTLISRVGPLLEKRWDRFVVGGSWAPTLEWRRYEYDGSTPIPGGIRRTTSEGSRTRIITSSEVHVRYEF